MRVGILGGSFDPVHQAHLILGECAREQAGLDEVWFVPAAVSPHKQVGPRATDEERLAMLELAIAGHPAFRTSDVELKRGGISYTADTLRQLHREHPPCEWYLLLGADALADLPQWREPAAVSALATLVVAARPGSGPPDVTGLTRALLALGAPPPRCMMIEMPQMELASRDLRARVQAGRSIRYQTPRAVEKYIQTHELYGAQTRPRH